MPHGEKQSTKAKQALSDKTTHALHRIYLKFLIVLWQKRSQAAFSFEDKEKHTSDKTISKKENRAPNPSELVWGFISQGTEGNKSFAALPKMTFPPLTQPPDTQTRHPPTTTTLSHLHLIPALTSFASFTLTCCPSFQCAI